MLCFYIFVNTYRAKLSGENYGLIKVQKSFVHFEQFVEHSITFMYFKLLENSVG